MEIFMSEDFDQSSIPKKLIVELDDGWYFMDETWCYDGNGPFATAEEAHRQLNAYVVYLNTGEYPDTH
jgi:hypothetical protein